MRCLCFCLLLLALLSSASYGQNYRLELYSDDALSNCELSYSTPGLVKVHMVINGQGGPLLAASFSANMPVCMRNATFIADIWEQTTVRSYYQNTQNPDRVDVVLDCPPNVPPFTSHNLPVYLGWMWFSVTGPADPCCVYRAKAPLSLPAPYLIMCASPAIEYPMTTAPLVINPDQTCRCALPVATQPSTWGSVKALYR